MLCIMNQFSAKRGLFGFFLHQHLFMTRNLIRQRNPVSTLDVNVVIAAEAVSVTQNSALCRYRGLGNN